MKELNEIFAMYLPQFHRIPENDKWWGDGFTEWDNVKSAMPLYKGHLQPQVPLDGYYDLSNVESIRHQAKLARKYNITGFCFYHYYSVGKKLLQKPAELLLGANDIDIEYFFSWANHDWRRTWYKYNNEMLFEQRYGGEEEIRAHYEYLRQFFCDRRYKKIHNKPIFIVYRSDSVPDFHLLKDIWNAEAQKDGFDGVFFVSTVTGMGVDNQAKDYDAYFDFEPDSIIAEQISPLKRIKQSWRARIVPRINKILPFKVFRQRFNYKYLLKMSADIRVNHKDKPYISGAFARWDNTPRHSYNSRLILGSTPDLFKVMLKNRLCDENGTGIIIVNSWNEWSEGSNIEPNTFEGTKYLEAIKEAIYDTKLSQG